jgi:GMP synthase-like glutamine amidotransferase
MTKYKVHYIQHVPFEGLGYIETWVRDNGFGLTATRMYEDYRFPDTESFDMLVIMGGPMGVYEEDTYTWLKDEKAFVRKAVDAGKVVVGICLGSQIIAGALGARVYPNREKEIGWLPVVLTDREAQDLFSSGGQSPVVFQWHGDTFDLPDGARLLASSEVCVNQAFLYKEKVLGLQFHIEVTEKSCVEMLNNGLDELVAGKCIQSEHYIRENTHYISSCNKMMESVLRKLIGS